MKKLLVVFALLALTFAAFGQIQLSAGAGGTFVPYADKATMEVMGVSDSSTMTQSAFGGKVFFDATYVEASVGFLTNSKNYKVKSESGTNSYSDGAVGTWISMAAVGKYPIKLGSFTLFPMIGAQFNYCLSYKDDDGTDLKSSASDAGYDYNQMMIKAGIGADISVSEKMFVRPSIAFNYIILSDLDKAALEMAEAIYESMLGMDVSMKEFKSAWEIGVAVGFKF